MTTPLGIIKNSKNHIYGIPYITTFIVLKNSVVDSSYSMLLRKPRFRDAKVTHDCGKNVMTIQGDGTIKTISINKKLGLETKKPQIHVCYELMQRLTSEDEDLIFEIERKLFPIDTITVLEETISLLSVEVPKIESIKESDSKQRTLDQTSTKVVPSTMKSKEFCVRPKVSLENKVYPESYYHHNQDNIQVDETTTKIQV
jgi:hypothetical protein